MQPNHKKHSLRFENMIQDIDKIVIRCKNKDKRAQKKLYDIYAPVLFGICLRYAADRAEAEDILQESFTKILIKISGFGDKGSFEGWMKRIVVNTAISNYHKNKKHNQTSDIDSVSDSFYQESEIWAQDFTPEELMKVINSLPTGYRTVFNLYAIEGFRHKEISEKLEIDVNTSKSQYSRARKLIQSKLEKISKINLDERKA